MCKINCQKCGKETTNKKYCSRSCSASSNNILYPKRSLQRTCKKCDNIVKNKNSTLCQKCFDEKAVDLKKMTLFDYSNRKSINRLHPSSKFVHVRLSARSFLKHLTKLPCANCGYDKHVELCHIKAVSSFPLTATLGEVNNENNIIQLCRNCHWEFDNGLLHLDFPEQLKSL